MGNPIFGQYADNLLKLNAASKSGTLYRKDFIEGKVENKSIAGFLLSVFKHVFYRVTFQSNKIQTIEDQRLKTLFGDNIDFIQNQKSQPSPKYANLSIKTLHREQFSILSSISKQFEKKYPFAQQIIENNTHKWIDKELGNAPVELKEMFEKSLLCDLDPKIVKLIANGNFESLSLRSFLNHLGPHNQKFIDKCLILAPKINAYQKNAASDPEQAKIAGLDSNEMMAISKIAGSVYRKLEPLHQRFKEEYGPVSIVDGEPMPNLKQLKGAFKMTMQEVVPSFRPDSLKAESKILMARMTQYILCGQEIDQVKFPEDEFCFTSLEFSKMKDNMPLPTQYRDPLEWHIENTKRYREINHIDTSAQTLIATAKQCVDDYLESFVKDLNRDLRPTSFNGNFYNLCSPKGVSALFYAIREDYFHQLLNPKQREEWLKFNERINDSACIPNNLNKSQFEKLLTNAKKKDSSNSDSPLIDAILAEATFDSEQMSQLLSDVDVDPAARKKYQEVFNAQLRSRFLQIMVFINQSSSGIDPKLFGGDLMEHPTFKLVNHFQTSFIPIAHRLQYDLGSNHHQTIDEFAYYLPRDEAIDKYKVDTRFDGEDEDKTAILHLQRRFNIPNFIPEKDGRKAQTTLINYENLYFRIQSLPMLDEIKKTFKEK